MSARDWQPLIDLVGPQLAGAFVWVDEYSYGHTTVQVYKHAVTRLPVHIAQDGRVLDEVSGEEIDPEDALEDLFGAWQEAACEAPPMHFMVIERFRAGARPVYERFGERGRLMPDGLDFVASWVSADLGRVFQVMQCDDVTLLHQWVANWEDLAEFEIVPVAPGGSAVADAVLRS